MHPGRVDVIGAGALVLDRIMQDFGFAEVVASEHDILDGIAWSLAGPHDRAAVTGPCRRAPAGRAIRPRPRRPSPATPLTSVRWPPAAGTLAELTARQSVCRACPRLVAWREQVAVDKRRSFRREPYWGRPVPGWGAEQPRVLIVGLAPAAHGGNRTGRIFTGDRSGDVLFASLWRCGLAAQPTSVARRGRAAPARRGMAAAVRCAPPPTSRPSPSGTPARPG